MNVNVNSAECVKEVLNIGSTTFVNICNGTQTSLPWGSGDWTLFSLVAAVALLFLLILAFGIYDILFN